MPTGPLPPAPSDRFRQKRSCTRPRPNRLQERSLLQERPLSERSESELSEPASLHQFDPTGHAPDRVSGVTRRSIRIDYPDDDVQLRVSRFLSTRHFSTFMDIEVQVLHGEVTLTGEVDTFYEKQVAMTSCQHVAGVLGLVDHINVRKPK